MIFSSHHFVCFGFTAIPTLQLYKEDPKHPSGKPLKNVYSELGVSNTNNEYLLLIDQSEIKKVIAVNNEGDIITLNEGTADVKLRNMHSGLTRQLHILVTPPLRRLSDSAESDIRSSVNNRVAKVSTNINKTLKLTPEENKNNDEKKDNQ